MIRNWIISLLIIYGVRFSKLYFGRLLTMSCSGRGGGYCAQHAINLCQRLLIRRVYF